MGDRESFINDIRRLVARYSSTSVGERFVLSLNPDYSRAVKDFKLIGEVLREHEMGRSLSLPVFPDMDEVFDYFNKFGVLTGEKLYSIAEFIERSVRLREGMHSINLASYINITKELLGFSERIKANISKDGSIKTVKNPILRDLYEKRNKIRDELLNLYAEIINKYWDKLRERQPVMKNGRLTLPVISNYKIDGVVHGYSYTTETVFVEPYEVIPLQNQLIQIDDRIREEEKRILGKLLNDFLRLKDNLINLHKSLGFIDSIYARAKFYLEYKCCFPEFSKDGRFELRECREPILYSRLKEKTVPISLNMDKFALLITGPNAGGKTVSLRTVAYCVLMASMGIPVPAKKAVIPFGSDVFPLGFTPLGSVEEGVSHFVGELKRINGILKGVKEYDIVIFDEIFSSTDPDEASALAYAIGKYLSDKRVYIFMSTHFSSLKILAQHSEFFNISTLENYRLVIGKLGESRGIYTAKVVGLPEEIIKYAEDVFVQIPSYIQKLRERYEDKVKKLEREKREIEDLKRKLIVALASAKEGKQPEEAEKILRTGETLEVGKEYFIKNLGVKGTLIEIKGNKAKVKVRNIVIEIDKDSLV
ncbi:MAG: hypothetical protein ABIL16_04920 [candidate division WOR-3 bacterium]